MWLGGQKKWKEFIGDLKVGGVVSGGGGDL